ncbi:hypothetical protein [Undibacterium sp. SXout20W]|uniref:hypothetical protein n=1 Tax=Undibacterium sp. SXout20W TaxID=3413051 RepID=UPI003BF41B53
MTFKNLFVIFCPVAVMTFCTPVHSGEVAQQISVQEILAKVVGNTIEFQNDAKDRVRFYFDRDGNAYGSSRANGKFVDAWQIRFGNNLCLVSDDPQKSGCVTVFLPKKGLIEFHRRDGILEGPFKLLLGKPGS